MSEPYRWEARTWGGLHIREGDPMVVQGVEGTIKSPMKIAERVRKLVLVPLLPGWSLAWVDLLPGDKLIYSKTRERDEGGVGVRTMGVRIGRETPLGRREVYWLLPNGEKLALDGEYEAVVKLRPELDSSTREAHRTGRT